MITEYWEKFEEAGGEILFATRATEILTEDGAAVGVLATDENGGQVTVNAGAVVLATGGFGYDLERCYELKPELTGMITNNQPGATGDGMDMAEAIGANLIDMEQIQAHPTVEQTTATLVTEGVRNAGGILLNASGERFCAEVGFRDVVAGHILEQERRLRLHRVQPRICTTATATSPPMTRSASSPTAKTPPPSPEYIGCDVGSCGRHLCRLGTLPARRRTTPSSTAPLNGHRDITASGPWYVIKIAPGIHHTMGGVEINTETEVISTEGEPIPGLYAAGEVTGGVHGGNRIGGNALMDCQVFGQIAGENAAKYAKG